MTLLMLRSSYPVGAACLPLTCAVLFLDIAPPTGMLRAKHP